MAAVTDLELDVDSCAGSQGPTGRVTHGQQRRPKREAGAPAAAVAFIGGRKEWCRRQLQRGRDELRHTLSEPTLRRTPASAVGTVLPQIALAQQGECSGQSHGTDSSSGAAMHLNASRAVLNVFEHTKQSYEPSASDLPWKKKKKRKALRAEQPPQPESDDGPDQRAAALVAALEQSGVKRMSHAALTSAVEALLTLGAPWKREKEAYLSEIRALTSRPDASEALSRKLKSLQASANLYAFLEAKPVKSQGLEALAEALAFKFNSVEHFFRYLDDTGNDELSFIEFVLGMNLLELNVHVLCGMDERDIFHYIDQDSSGSLSLKEFLSDSGRGSPKRGMSEAGGKVEKGNSKPQGASKLPSLAAQPSERLGTAHALSRAGLRAVGEISDSSVRLRAMAPIMEGKGRYRSGWQAFGAFDAGETADTRRLVASRPGSFLDTEAVDRAVSAFGKEAILQAQLKWADLARWLAAATTRAHALPDLQTTGRSFHDPVIEWLLPKPAKPPPAKAPGSMAGASGDSACSHERGRGQDEFATSNEAALESRMTEMFVSASNAADSGGSRLMNCAALRCFFDDLLLADQRWYNKLGKNMVMLDLNYKEVIKLQEDAASSSNGLTSWGFKIVIHKMLQEIGERWMSILRQHKALHGG